MDAIFYKRFLNNILGEMFAIHTLNPKPGKYSIHFWIQNPGYQPGDYTPVENEKMMRLFPQHEEVLRSLFKL